jgi:hypothetical protein
MDCVFPVRGFSLRAEQTFERCSLAALKLSNSSFQPETADELLESLEEIEPGFVKWAESLKK